MLSLLIYSALSHRVNLHLKSGVISTLPDYFYFQANGSYSIQIQANVQNHYNIYYEFLICSKSEYRTFVISRNRNICTYYGRIKIDKNSTVGESSGLIEKAGGYQFLFYPTYDDEKSKVTVLLRNPNSYLDAHVQPCLYSEPVFCGILIIILIGWTINWIVCGCNNWHQSGCTFTLHEFITITYFVTIVYSLCQIFDLWIRHRKDISTPLTKVTIGLRFLQYWVLFSTMLMASKGWCIVHATLSKKNVFLCILNSLFVSVPLVLLEYIQLGKWAYLVVLLGMIGIFVYYRFLMKAIRDATLYVIAHLVVISNEGIEPSTTPVHSKYRMFRIISWGVVMYFILAFLVSSAASFADIPYYIEDLLQDAITLTVLIGAAFIFRLKREMRNGYMMIGDIDENVEPQKFAKDEIKGMSIENIEYNENNEGMREWEEGMALPPQPLLLENETKKVDKVEKDEREEELIKDGSVDV